MYNQIKAKPSSANNTSWIANIPVGMIFSYPQLFEGCLFINTEELFKKCDYPELMDALPYLKNSPGESFSLTFRTNENPREDLPPHLAQF